MSIAHLNGVQRLNFIQKLAQPAATKIVMLIIDGIGGLPDPKTGKTELETANPTILNELARSSSVLGMMNPIGPGITPGSGPGHLALFGYNPIDFQVGRGLLEALGENIKVKKGDLCARGNFAALDSEKKIIDRRAGRIPTEKNIELVTYLNRKIGLESFLDDVEAEIYSGIQHRLTVVFKGINLSESITETDPQKEGVSPLKCTAIDPTDDSAALTAMAINDFVSRVERLLADQEKANGILLRGFSLYKKLPQWRDVYKMNPLAIATYPMYRGVAKLVGMDVYWGLTENSTLEEVYQKYQENFSKYDFFYLHVKKTDSAGEDGNFEKKAELIKEADEKIVKQMIIDGILPDVLIVTGDHSTPASMKAHSFHPVPLMIWSKENIDPDARILPGQQMCHHCNHEIKGFSEYYARYGSLGMIPAVDIMFWAMAYAGRLEKYGA